MRVSVYHNIAPDIADRMVHGCQPGHPLVRVFETDTGPGGNDATTDEVADWIWTARNIDPGSDMLLPRLQAIATAYRHYGLRSLSFLGK